MSFAICFILSLIKNLINSELCIFFNTENLEEETYGISIVGIAEDFNGLIEKTDAVAAEECAEKSGEAAENVADDFNENFLGIFCFFVECYAVIRPGCNNLCLRNASCAFVCFSTLNKNTVNLSYIDVNVLLLAFCIKNCIAVCIN